ncbi:MAG: Hsp20/alpha crystallin family protein [Bacteroidota bacterium]
MAITRYDPFDVFEGLTNRMERSLNDYGNLPRRGEGWLPGIDISQDESKIYVEAELPGMKKEDIKISVSDDKVLLIRGKKERKVEENDENKTWYRMERSYGEFARAFRLPDNADTENVKAGYKDGVLKLEIQKSEPDKPAERQIDIS